jgi:gas vesicle protein
VSEFDKLREKLSGNHRRVLSVRLRLLEELSAHFGDLFREGNLSLKERHALSHNKSENVLRVVGELRSKVSQMKNDLGPEVERIDAVREAKALASAMQVDIVSCAPDTSEATETYRMR